MADPVTMSERLAAAVQDANHVLDNPDASPLELYAAGERLRTAVESAHADAVAEINRRFLAAYAAMRDAFALARSVEISFGRRSDTLRAAEARFLRLKSPTGTGVPEPRLTCGGRLEWREAPGALAFYEAHRAIFPLLQYAEGEARLSRWGTRTTGIGVRLVREKDTEVSNS